MYNCRGGGRKIYAARLNLENVRKTDAVANVWARVNTFLMVRNMANIYRERRGGIVACPPLSFPSSAFYPAPLPSPRSVRVFGSVSRWSGKDTARPCVPTIIMRTSISDLGRKRHRSWEAGSCTPSILVTL